MAQQVVALGTGPDTSGADTHYAANTKHNANFTELYGPVPQIVVAAAATLALTAAHIGATIVLNGAGATVSGNATTLGDGFVCLIRNRTGTDWTVPAFANGTNEFEEAGHTKIVSGKSAGLEIYTRSSVRYVCLTGATI